MYKDKHYGLTGQTVKVKLKNGDSPSFPWQGMTVPVVVVAEYETFLTCEVLPHLAPHGFGLSKPYIVTICKHDIHTGELIINGGNVQ